MSNQQRFNTGLVAILTDDLDYAERWVQAHRLKYVKHTKRGSFQFDMDFIVVTCHGIEDITKLRSLRLKGIIILGKPHISCVNEAHKRIVF